MQKSLNYENILLKHGKCLVNSRSECDISTEIAGKKISAPIFCSNMPAVLNKNICRIFDELGWFHIYHRLGGYDDIKQYVLDFNLEKRNFTSISLGVKNEDYDLLKWLKYEGYVNSITIDIAFSWCDNVEKIIKFIKKYFPDTYLIVGNGDNPEWIKWLEDLGVNAAKMNIGVSKSCRTRQFTGFGSTTISDLEKCANVKKYIKIISDGGISKCETGEPAIGDCAKAIRFGADYIMSGFLFSQCIDSPSIKDGYYGNSTEKAKSHSNNIEGAVLNVKTNGLTINEQIKLIEDSLRSSVSYSGGNTLENLKFVEYIYV